MAFNSSIYQLVVDFFCLAVVFGAHLLVPKLYGEGNGQRGFFCDDDSIRYPYRESFFSAKIVGAIGFLGPVLTMVVVESVRFRICASSASRAQPNYNANAKSSYGTVPIQLGSLNIPPIVVELAHLIAVFLFGAGCSQLATDIGKYSIGRLRPHFIDVCKPENLESLCAIDSHRYIEDFVCTGSDAKKLHDARLSFPSGHASFSAYTMLFLALYLQARMNWSRSRLLKPLLQLIALMLTWFTGLSRVSDYKHHWSDVLSGFLIGIIAASLTALYISPLFKPRASNTQRSLLPQAQRDIGMDHHQPTESDPVDP